MARWDFVVQLPVMAVQSVPRLDLVEVATGLVMGDGVADDAFGRIADPQLALERAILPALQRPPCIVGFSGGRDSSIVFAAALAAARREGLPMPIAFTVEFESPDSRETEWQERLVRHLGADDWVRVPIGAELDLLGEVATDGLRRHGLLYPANAHFIVPLATAARGGSVLTGIAGDSVLGEWPWHDVASLFARRRRPRPRDLRRGAHWSAPLPVRAAVLRRRAPECQLPWLRDTFRRTAATRLARELARAPRTWKSRVRWLARLRAWQAAQQSIAILAAHHDAVASAPLLDRTFLEALAVRGGSWGWGNRTETLRAVFGELLPGWILERSSKAEFSAPFFGPATQRFARDWDGRAGIDPSRIDGTVLRTSWLGARPNFQSSTLLQATWLAVHGDRVTPEPSLGHSS
jgi:hypothetical protein